MHHMVNFLIKKEVILSELKIKVLEYIGVNYQKNTQKKYNPLYTKI
jgi:hypothetical protein